MQFWQKWSGFAYPPHAGLQYQHEVLVQGKSMMRKHFVQRRGLHAGFCRMQNKMWRWKTHLMRLLETPPSTPSRQSFSCIRNATSVEAEQPSGFCRVQKKMSRWQMPLMNFWTPLPILSWATLSSCHLELFWTALMCCACCCQTLETLPPGHALFTPWFTCHAHEKHSNYVKQTQLPILLMGNCQFNMSHKWACIARAWWRTLARFAVPCQEMPIYKHSNISCRGTMTFCICLGTRLAHKCFFCA